MGYYELLFRKPLMILLKLGGYWRYDVSGSAVTRVKLLDSLHTVGLAFSRLIQHYSSTFVVNYISVFRLSFGLKCYIY